MKLSLYSVGKSHETYVKQGIDDFTKRLNKYFSAEWKIIAPPKNAAALGDRELKLQEGKLIAAQLQQDDFLILLDEKGKSLSSPELANFVQQRANESIKQVVFLIGGAFGVSDEIFKRANFIWSLSPLVFPHMLVRLILAEQLYRACTILHHEKYHHE